MKKKLDKQIEFETKYLVAEATQYKFKDLVAGLSGLIDFLYVEGPDVYWTKDDDTFQRPRRAALGTDSCAWLTNKFKQVEGNNIIRVEHNIRVDSTPQDEIAAYVESMGYKYNFQIYKNCHIYRFNDATLVYYSVKDEKGIRNYFVEIEVNESTIHTLTEMQAWAVVRKYEDVLKPIGISAQHRLRKSLFEIYKKNT